MCYKEAMPKPSVIRCVLDEQRKAQNRKAVYRVSIPAELSETGKRQNRYFTTQREGNAFAAQLRTRRNAEGSSVFQVSAAEAQLFREAQDILEPYGVDVFGFVKGMAPVLELVQEVSEIGRLVRMGLEQEKRDSKSIPFCDAVSRLLEVKQDVQKRRESTLAQIRYITGRIGKCCPDFAVTLLSQLTTEDCRQMISQTFKPDKQKNDARKILSSIFNFGIKRKWCRDNPAQALDIISIQEHEIHPLIPEEIQALFLSLIHI